MRALEAFAAVLLYGAFHSLTAAKGCKDRISARIGERAFLGLYRLSYSVVSFVTLLPVLGLLERPGRTVWSLSGEAAGVIAALRALAGLGLALALLQIDGLRFLGFKEAHAYFRGRPLPLPPERLVTRGVYRVVRHPLYLFSILALWASPTMTESFLGFALGATLYFVAGSALEEKRMTAAFGPGYAAYRGTVPWLVPFLMPRRSRGPSDGPRCSGGERPAEGPGGDPPRTRT